MKQRGRWVLVEDSPGYLAFIFPNLVLRHSNQAASCHPASSTRAPAQPPAFSDSTCKQWTPSQLVSLHVYVHLTQALKMLQGTTLLHPWSVRKLHLRFRNTPRAEIIEQGPVRDVAQPVQQAANQVCTADARS